MAHGNGGEVDLARLVEATAELDTAATALEKARADRAGAGPHPDPALDAATIAGTRRSHLAGRPWDQRQGAFG